MQATLNKWRRERDEIIKQLGETTPKDDAKKMIDAAIAQLYRLRDNLANSGRYGVSFRCDREGELFAAPRSVSEQQ